MIRINTESENYDLVANIISTIVGIGASALVGTFCDNIIQNNANTSNDVTKMRIGRAGFKFITVNAVSNHTRSNLDDLAHGWNAIADILEGVNNTVPIEPEVVVE